MTSLQLHCVGWAAILLVAAALTWCQVDELITQPPKLYRPFIIGWPLLFHSWQAERVWEFNVFALFVDLLVCFAILGSTVAVVRSLLGLRGKWWQFRLRTLLSFVAMIAVTISIVQIESHRGVFDFLFFRYHLEINRKLGTSAWWVSIPLLFGLACLIWTFGTIMTRLTATARTFAGRAQESNG